MSNIVTEPGSLCLQEVALAEGGIMEEHETERKVRQERFLKDIEMTDGASEERKMKTASLKRFFRLNERKKSAEQTQAAMVSGDHKHTDVQEKNPTDDDNEEETLEVNHSKQDSLKRFRLRLSGIYRYSDSPDSASKLDLNSADSKVTLKSSLSTYWNSVFKKKKSKSVHEVIEREEMPPPRNNFSESTLQRKKRGNSLAEDVHALQISDDPSGNL